MKRIYFGDIYIDEERFIVVPVIQDGTTVTDYEVRPEQVTAADRETWINHFREKSKIVTPRMLDDFTRAYDYHLNNNLNPLNL